MVSKALQLARFFKPVDDNSIDENLLDFTGTEISSGAIIVSTWKDLPSGTAGQTAYVTSTKSIHFHDGTEWDKVSSGLNSAPIFTVTPPGSLVLNEDGTPNTISAVAIDPEYDSTVFPIQYDYKIVSGSDSYTSSSGTLPDHIVSIASGYDSTGIFMITPSTSNSGSSIFTTIASDGVKSIRANTDLSLSVGGISNITYDSLFLGVGSAHQNETNPTIIAFNPNGTKMFVCGTNGRKVLQYSLSSAFSLSGASYDSVQFDISGQATYATDLKFNSTGNKMYITDDTTNATYRYTLPTGFHLASASYDNVSYNYSAAISPTSVSQIAFNNNGTKLYISSNEVITQCSLSTAYDPSTFTTDSKSFDAGSQVDEATNISFNNDGTKMFMGDMSDNTVYQYSLGTAFDISTTSYDNVNYTFTEDTAIRGLTFADNGSKLFMAGTQRDRIYQYSV